MRTTAILFAAAGVCISFAVWMSVNVAAGLFSAGGFLLLAAYVAILWETA